MQTKIPYESIARYLSGEITPDERKSLDSWRALLPENENIFQEYREVWTLISATGKSEIPDKEVVWSKLTSKMKILKTKQLYTRSFLMRIAGIAATIALIIGLSFSYFTPIEKTSPLNDIIVKTQGGQKSEIILPDGTAVWLNSGSMLTYNTAYGIENRSVKLEGEAFFDVTHNDKVVFEIISGDVKTLVHGTAFGIKAYRDEPAVDISLLRGHVTVHSVSTDKLLADLKPNQKAIISKNTLTSVIEACNVETENIWRYGKLKFEGESVAEVMNMISRWYGINISIKGQLKNDHYWFTIKTESLTEMLSLINRITPINYTINGEEVTIQYK